MVIERNLDFIAEVDRIINLGPEAGDSSGKVIAEGTPEQITRKKKWPYLLPEALVHQS